MMRFDLPRVLASLLEEEGYEVDFDPEYYDDCKENKCAGCSECQHIEITQGTHDPSTNMILKINEGIAEINIFSSASDFLTTKICPLNIEDPEFLTKFLECIKILDTKEIDMI